MSIRIVIFRRRFGRRHHFASKMSFGETLVFDERVNLVEADKTNQHVGRCIVRLGDH
ncbi:hypothetical protein D3C81_1820810 [compost metagenome]